MAGFIEHCVREGDRVESTRNLSLLFSVTNILALPKAIKFMSACNVIVLFLSFFIGITGDENYSISFNFFLFLDCSDNNNNNNNYLSLKLGYNLLFKKIKKKQIVQLLALLLRHKPAIENPKIRVTFE